MIQGRCSENDDRVKSEKKFSIETTIRLRDGDSTLATYDVEMCQAWPFFE
ncbi:hypothetical protein QG37_00885 [Candidozyma auris]|nr:hypothetical protein QG37_00885 [[Candida] auris]